MEEKQAKRSGKSTKPEKDMLEVIRNRAYDIFLERIEQGYPGDADSDWIQAEKELRK